MRCCCRCQAGRALECRFPGLPAAWSLWCETQLCTSDMFAHCRFQAPTDGMLCTRSFYTGFRAPKSATKLKQCNIFWLPLLPLGPPQKRIPMFPRCGPASVFQSRLEQWLRHGYVHKLDLQIHQLNNHTFNPLSPYLHRTSIWTHFPFGSVTSPMAGGHLGCANRQLVMCDSVLPSPTAEFPRLNGNSQQLIPQNSAHRIIP